MPSYYVFSDGIYPQNYPPHPNPPPQLPQVTNNNRQYQLRPPQMLIAQKDVNLKNTQRMPITVDFTKIANAIRQINW